MLNRISGLSRWLIMSGILAASARMSAQDTQDIPSPPAQHQHPVGGDPVALFPPPDASGTAWQPDETPMYGVQRTWGGWDVMLHDNASAQFLYEPGYIHQTGGFSTRDKLQ